MLESRMPIRSIRKNDFSEFTVEPMARRSSFRSRDIIRANVNFFFFFSSRRRHTRFDCDWSSDVCSSILGFGTTDPGAPLASTSTVHVLSDGSVVLLCGTVEIGQGAKTVMSQIVAEELAVTLEKVIVRPIDTAFTPFDRSTGSSRSTTVMGKAVELAGKDARQQLLELAAEEFEAPTDAITLKDGRALVGSKKIS